MRRILTSMKRIAPLLFLVLLVPVLPAQLVSKSAFWGLEADWSAWSSVADVQVQDAALNLRFADGTQGRLSVTDGRSVHWELGAPGSSDVGVGHASSVPGLVPTGTRTLTRGDLVVTLDLSRLTLSVRRQGRLVVNQSVAPRHRGPWVAASLDLPAGDRYYGLGEKAGGLSRAGGSYKLWNTDAYGWSRNSDPLYLDIPWILGFSPERSWGVFFNNTQQAYVDVGRDRAGQLQVGATAGALDLWFFVDATPAGVLEAYTAVTGRMPPPPVWALGYHQSKYSYMTQAEVLDTVKTFEDKHLPGDVIYLDIDFMDGNRDFTWNRTAFPDPKAMIDELHAQGWRVITIIDPGIKIEPGYGPYDSGLAADVFLRGADGQLLTGKVWPGLCVFPDFRKPQTQAWWTEQYRVLTDLGFDGIWNDMNEPAVFDAPGGTLALDGPGAEVHNVYGFQESAATLVALDALRPHQRNFVLSRAGFAGSQASAAFWTGDNTATWDHLKLNLSMVLSLGLSGIPLSGADVGGYIGNPDPELFGRWMQLGALMPYFRNHTAKGHEGHEPWKFGERAEAISRSALELRRSLVPYLSDVTWQSTWTGAPVVRPLFWSFPQDPRAVATEDEFLVGDALLAAPVLVPGARAREVWLPAGSDWYDWYTGHRWSGGQLLRLDVTLESLPLFVRAGGVIPTNDAEGNRIYRVFPGPSLNQDLVSDDGLTDGWKEGKQTIGRLGFPTGTREGGVRWTTLSRGYSEASPRVDLRWPDGTTQTMTRF